VNTINTLRIAIFSALLVGFRVGTDDCRPTVSEQIQTIGKSVVNVVGLPTRDQCRIFSPGFTAPTFEGVRDVKVEVADTFYSNGINQHSLPYWHSIVTGADLAREYLQGMPKLGDPSIGLMDTSFDLSHLPYDRLDIDPQTDWRRSLVRTLTLDTQGDHGDHVAGNIVNRSPYGVAEKGTIRSLVSVANNWDFRDGFRFISNKDTRLVNISMSLNGLPKTALDTIADGRRIVVTTSGNDFPKAVEPAAENENVILVGAIDATGHVAGYSQESDAVVIGAPDECFQTYENPKARSVTNGTSCSAPIVTGALANVVAILPELKVSEAKVLLQKTAVQTPNAYQTPRKNGAGMVNAYKLVKVAERIRKALDGGKSMDAVLKDQSLFEFASEAKSNFDEGIQLITSGDCEKQKRGEKLIRASLLLDENEPAREVLRSLYSLQGYPTQSGFLATLDASAKPKSVRSQMK
jgi:hypothetical protein